MRVVGYVRLSKGCGIGANGHSLDGQRESIQQWAKANGHDLVTVVAEVATPRPHTSSLVGGSQSPRSRQAWPRDWWCATSTA